MNTSTNESPDSGRAKQIRDRAGTAAWLKGYLVALDDVAMHMDELHTEADLRAWLYVAAQDTNTALQMVIEEDGSHD